MSFAQSRRLSKLLLQSGLSDWIPSLFAFACVSVEAFTHILAVLQGHTTVPIRRDDNTTIDYAFYMPPLAFTVNHSPEHYFHMFLTSTLVFTAFVYLRGFLLVTKYQQNRIAMQLSTLRVLSPRRTPRPPSSQRPRVAFWRLHFADSGTRAASPDGAGPNEADHALMAALAKFKPLGPDGKPPRGDVVLSFLRFCLYTAFAGLILQTGMAASQNALEGYASGCVDVSPAAAGLAGRLQMFVSGPEVPPDLGVPETDFREHPAPHELWLGREHLPPARDENEAPHQALGPPLLDIALAAPDLDRPPQEIDPGRNVAPEVNLDAEMDDVEREREESAAPPQQPRVLAIALRAAPRNLRLVCSGQLKYVYDWPTIAHAFGAMFASIFIGLSLVIFTSWLWAKKLTMALYRVCCCRRAADVTLLTPTWVSVLVKTALLVLPVLQPQRLFLSSVFRHLSLIDYVGLTQRVNYLCLLVYVATLGAEVRQTRFGIRSIKRKIGQLDPTRH